MDAIEFLKQEHQKRNRSTSHSAHSLSVRTYLMVGSQVPALLPHGGRPRA